MKIFLVGGAVRDKLMGLPIKDKDYLVVGSSPEEMVRLGYKPIGKDFPVFIHPESKQEYALARTEKKISKGYHGFNFFTSPQVSLEDDLKRRDITINAIAEDEDGKTFDPFNGIEDIKNKIIKHVSAAFVEDPLRVLRVARFTARFKEFEIHEDTLNLMKQVCSSDEMNHLSSDRVKTEIFKGLDEGNPNVMFKVLKNCNAIEKIFPAQLSFLDDRLSHNLNILFRYMAEANFKAESKFIMMILLPTFCDKENLNTNEVILRYFNLSSQLQKKIKSIKAEAKNIIKFSEISNESKIDCLYRLDFFRRPLITLEIIKMTSILLIASIPNEKNNLTESELKKNEGKILEKIDAVNKILEKFILEVGKTKINKKITSENDGEKIKKLIYNNRLFILKKLVIYQSNH